MAMFAQEPGLLLLSGSATQHAAALRASPFSSQQIYSAQQFLLLWRTGFLILNLQIVHDLLDVRHSHGNRLGAGAFVL
jgi:hypothetical protein